MCELATWQAPVKFSFLDVHLVKGLNEDVAHLACFCVGVRWCAVTPQSSSAFFDGILFWDSNKAKPQIVFTRVYLMSSTHSPFI